MCISSKPTANFIRIGPRYLGVESCVVIIKPGDKELQLDARTVT